MTISILITGSAKENKPHWTQFFPPLSIIHKQGCGKGSTKSLPIDGFPPICFVLQNSSDSP